MTDEERHREVARLIVAAFHLSDTCRLASVHHQLGLAAIVAAREIPVSLNPIAPPSVVRLHPRLHMNSSPDEVTTCPSD